MSYYLGLKNFVVYCMCLIPYLVTMTMLLTNSEYITLILTLSWRFPTSWFWILIDVAGTKVVRKEMSYCKDSFNHKDSMQIFAGTELGLAVCCTLLLQQKGSRTQPMEASQTNPRSPETSQASTSKLPQPPTTKTSSMHDRNTQRGASTRRMINLLLLLCDI